MGGGYCIWVDFNLKNLPWGEKFLGDEISKGNVTLKGFDRITIQILFNCLTLSLANLACGDGIRELSGGYFPCVLISWK